MHIIATRYIVELEHNNEIYHCTVTSDFKSILEIDPITDNKTELEQLIRDAAMSGKFDNDESTTF